MRKGNTHHFYCIIKLKIKLKNKIKNFNPKNIWYTKTKYLCLQTILYEACCKIIHKYFKSKLVKLNNQYKLKIGLKSCNRNCRPFVNKV